MNREKYLQSYPLHKDMREHVKKDKNRLHYHLMPPTGWMNDPNGLCQFQGVNHIYFQYSPFRTDWGEKIWGHYSTKDWINYIQEDPFLFPDTAWDRGGAYSGSAYIEDNEIHFFYTGNVKLTDKKYDYIMNGREQNVIHVISSDALNTEPKELVMTNADYPSDMSKHVRDPKVFKKGDKYYMILGARTADNVGCALLYVSNDLKSWTYISRINTAVKHGYMWECPDMFELNGQIFLLTCLQGLENLDPKYDNIYPCGYFKINSDFDTKIFSADEFTVLDNGFDIYACQTFDDDKGRKIMIGWMAVPDSPYRCDITAEYDWIHCLTLPRVLEYKNGKIFQHPLEEMKQLRGQRFSSALKAFTRWSTQNCCFELLLSFENKADDSLSIMLREDVSLTYSDSALILKLGKSGYGRNKRILKLYKLKNLQIFSDTSSIEIFINDGEYVLTTRVFSESLEQNISINYSGTSNGNIEIFDFRGFNYTSKE